jgi:hypothetical protein
MPTRTMASETLRRRPLVAHQAAPARHPAEGALHHPFARQDPEAPLAGRLAHDIGHEALMGGGAHPRPGLRPRRGAASIPPGIRHPTRCVRRG